MKKRIIAVAVCGLCMLAVGSAPRYLEELRIGGGAGDSADGGADLDKSGNITTDGAIACGGLSVEDGQVSAVTGLFSRVAGHDVVEAGEPDSAAGTLHVYGGAEGQSGAIHLHTSQTYEGIVDYWKLSSGLFGVLQVSGHGGSCDPGMILQFSPATGQVSFAYDTAIWGGGLELGRSGMEPVQGALTVYHHNSGTAPGYIKLYSCNGTPSYFFAANDGSGLRVDSSIPTSDTAGGWLTAGKFRGAGSTTDAVDLATSEVAGLLPAASVSGTLTDLQVADALTVWSGTVNNTPVGNYAPSTGKFSSLTLTGIALDTTFTTWPADTTSPTVSTGNLFKIPNTWSPGYNITSLTGGANGHRIVIVGGDSDCVVVDGGSLKLSANWTASPTDTLELLCDGTYWYEVA